jgi:hypothetical protein
VEKSSQKFGLLKQFSKYLPKVKIRKLGENSPNLVTLLVKYIYTYKLGLDPALTTSTDKHNLYIFFNRIFFLE